MHEQECGWWNSDIMIGNRKRVTLITVCRIADANGRGVNSSKYSMRKRNRKYNEH